MDRDQRLVNINGLANVILTVTKNEKLRQFYTRLLPAFGMTLVHDASDFCYHVEARTAIGIRKCDPEFKEEQFHEIFDIKT